MIVIWMKVGVHRSDSTILCDVMQPTILLWDETPSFSWSVKNRQGTYFQSIFLSNNSCSISSNKIWPLRLYFHEEIHCCCAQICSNWTASMCVGTGSVASVSGRSVSLPLCLPVGDGIDIGNCCILLCLLYHLPVLAMELGTSTNIGM